MITNTSNLVSVANVATRYKVSPQTVWRWLTRGVTGVRLRGTKVGGTYRIAEADLDAFIGRLNPNIPEGPETNVTPTALANDLDRDRRELAAAGI